MTDVSIPTRHLISRTFLRGRRWLFLLCAANLSMVAQNPLLGQVSVTNNNVDIHIPANAIFYVPGNFTDNSAGSGGKIVLEGLLEVKGHITSSATSFVEGSSGLGVVKMSGAADQGIYAGSGQAIYVPKLEVSKSGGSVVLASGSLSIGTGINFVSGNLILQNRNVTLAPSASLENERNGAQITGAGEVSIGISVLSSGQTYTNYAGLGLTLGTNYGSFGAMNLRRVHLNNNTSPYAVANGTTFLKYFLIDLSTNSNPSAFSALTFDYHVPVDPGSLDASQSSVYLSNNAGSTWRRLTGAPDVGNSLVHNTDVNVAGSASNVLAIAETVCNTRPGLNILTSPSRQFVGNQLKACVGEQVVLSNDPANAATYYRWRTPGGAITENANLVVGPLDNSYESGFYELYVRNDRGCEDTRLFQIDVLPRPVASFNHDPVNNRSCFGDEVAFNDMSSAVESGLYIAAWSWDFDDGAASSAVQHPRYTFSGPGTYDVELVVTNQYGCTSTNQRTDNVIVNALPTPDFDFEDLSGTALRDACQLELVGFENNSSYTNYDGATLDDPENGMKYDWSFGDGQTANNVFEPNHTYSSHGTMNVTLTVTDNAYQCTNQVTKAIVVDPRPVPAFHFEVGGLEIHGTADGVCEGVDVFFANNTTIADNSALSYVWDFDDGVTTTDVEPTHEYIFTSTPGKYAVNLEATSVPYGCVYSETIPLTVHPAPQGNFLMQFDEANITDICAGVDVDFINNSQIAAGTVGYTWDFGDSPPFSSGATTLSHAFTDPRVHTISLTRTSDKNCVNTVQRFLTVHANPVVDFVFSNVCDGEKVKLQNTTFFQTDAAREYSWDFGDAQSSTTTHPEHTYAAFGTYNVRLTATTTANCSSQTTKQVEVYQKPGFNIGHVRVSNTGSFLIDPTQDTSINASRHLPPGTSFRWTNQLGQELGTSATLSVTTSGTYYAQLTTGTPESCVTTVATPVYIVHRGDLGADRTVCQSTVLNGAPASRPATGKVTYQWKKDGAVLAETGSSLLLTESGEYAVLVTYSPNSVTMTPFSSYTDVVNIIVDDSPSLDLGPDLRICSGSSTTLSSSEVADSYVWENLQTGLEVGSGPTLEVTQAGQYKLTIEKGTCSASDVVAVEVLALPEAGFTTSASVVCEGQAIAFSNISFSMTSGDALVAHRWNFGDGQTSSEVSPSHVFTAAGTYPVVLEVETANGCIDTFQRSVTVDNPPHVNFEMNNGCRGAAVAFTNSSTASATPVTYSWDFGDDTSSALENPSHQYDEAGTYQVALTVSAGACNASLTQPIEIHNFPTVDLGGNVTTCGDELVFDAGAGWATYRWYDVPTGNTLGNSQTFTATENVDLGVELISGDGCISTQETSVSLNTPVVIDLGPDRQVCGPIELDAGNYPDGAYAWSTGATSRKITVSSSGTYSVTVLDQNGCSATDEVAISVAPQPAVDLGSDRTICSGQSVVLDAGNAGATFAWSTGASTRTITVTESGTYSVTVTQGSCVATDEITVNVLPTPVIDFSYNGGCQGDGITFTPSVSGEVSPADYLWTFGDGTQSASVSPSKVFSVAGSYSVSLKVRSANGCTTTVTRSVEVQAAPQPNFAFKNVCEDTALTFTNSTTFEGSLNDITFSWSFGDGGTSAAAEPEYTYSAPGSYTVRLTASTPSCERTQVKHITVKAAPSLDLGGLIETCEATVLLDAGNPGSRYKWQDNSTDRTLQASASGTYAVTVTAANGCAVTDVVEVMLLESQRPDLGPDLAVCGEVVLNPKAEAVTYLWSTGQTSRTITVNTSGTYWVETVSSDLCIHRDSIDVIVYPVPKIDLGADREVCSGEVVTLDASHAAAKSYLWSNGATSPIVEVTTSGTFSVELTTEKGCKYTEEVKITFNELPALDFADTYEACESLLLSVDNIRSEFLWSTGASGKSIKVVDSGLYWLKITDRKGCERTDTTSVVIRPKPVVDLGPDVALCFGETITLDAGVQSAYHWDDLSKNRTRDIGATGTYTVKVTNEFGCDATDQVRVTVKPSLGLQLEAEAIICSPEDFQLDAGVQNVTYSWTSNVGFTSKDKVIFPNKAGVYQVTVTAPDGCSETDAVNVKETTETIDASFLIPSTVVVAEEVHFVQVTDPEPLSYKWNFGNGFSSVKHSPSYIYYQEGEYTVTLTVSNGVCSDTEAKQLTVLASGPSEPLKDKVRFLELYRSNLYPNPSEDIVKIDLELSDEAPVLIQIFSLSGLKVAEYQFVGIEELVEFNMSGMLPGTYIMAIQSGRISKTIRFVKAY